MAIKVQCEVRITHEHNREVQIGRAPTIRVVSSDSATALWPLVSLCVFDTTKDSGEWVTVDGRDLVQAIENAMSTRR